MKISPKQLYTFFDPTLLPKRGDSQIEWLGSFDCCPRHRQDNYLSFSELILNAFFCYHSMESVPTLAVIGGKVCLVDHAEAINKQIN